MAFALVAPFVPLKAYYRLPTSSGLFEPPVDVDWVGRHECIVRVVDQAMKGDYYLECPYTNSRLLFWSPIIALGVVLLFSVGIRMTRGKPLVPVPEFAPAVEVLTGIMAVMVAFVSLFERPEFEPFLCLWGCPIGFLPVLDGPIRSRLSKPSQSLVSVKQNLFPDRPCY